VAPAEPRYSLGGFTERCCPGRKGDADRPGDPEGAPGEAKDVFVPDQRAAKVHIVADAARIGEPVEVQPNETVHRSLRGPADIESIAFLEVRIQKVCLVLEGRAEVFLPTGNTAARAAVRSRGWEQQAPDRRLLEVRESVPEAGELVGSGPDLLQGSPLVVVKDHPSEPPPGNQKLLGEAAGGDHRNGAAMLGRDASQRMKDVRSKGEVSVDLIADDREAVLHSEIQDLEKVSLGKDGPVGRRIVDHHGSNVLFVGGILHDRFEMIQITFPVVVGIEVVLHNGSAEGLGDFLVERESRLWNQQGRPGIQEGHQRDLERPGTSVGHNHITLGPDGWVSRYRVVGRNGTPGLEGAAGVRILSRARLAEDSSDNGFHALGTGRNV